MMDTGRHSTLNPKAEPHAGEPKAIPWSHVTPLRCGTDAHASMDVRAGQVVAWPTNLGWMMGPWVIFAALLNGAACAVFEACPTCFVRMPMSALLPGVL